MHQDSKQDISKPSSCKSNSYKSKFKLTKLLLSSFLAFSLIACGGNATPDNSGKPSEPIAAPVIPPDTGSAKPVAGLETIALPLVSSYYREIEFDNKTQLPGVQDFVYRPRQSRFSGFENWDLLATPYPWGVPAGGKWLHLNLNRDARIAIVVNEYAKPNESWLSSWEKGASKVIDETGSPVNYQTFTKDFSKGEIILPAIKDTRYTLLLAEKDGVPSVEPDLPEGINERPQPNETCPTWLSNRWIATGPDGNLYKSWQPQIDPNYWCYYSHEHGSDPSLVGYTPAFDYVAYYNNKQDERHEGFKGFAFKEDNVGWYINVHATTGLLTRACARFHTVVFFAKDLTTGEKLLELSYKGDYGALVSNANEDLIIEAKACPGQAAIAETTKAKRALRIFENGKDPGNYERWKGGTNRDLGMSFPDWSAGMEVDIRNPFTGCKDTNCTELSYTKDNGEQRTIRFTKLSISYDSLLDKSDGQAADGIFYTNPYGIVEDDDSKNTLKQFIKPGFEATLDGHYITLDAWRGLYQKGDHQPNLELEDAIGGMN